MFHFLLCVTPPPHTQFCRHTHSHFSMYQASFIRNKSIGIVCHLNQTIHHDYIYLYGKPKVSETPSPPLPSLPRNEVSCMIYESVGRIRRQTTFKGNPVLPKDYVPISMALSHKLKRFCSLTRRCRVPRPPPNDWLQMSLISLNTSEDGIPILGLDGKPIRDANGNFLGEEVKFYPMTKFQGRAISHQFMFVFAEMLKNHEFKAVKKVTDILSEVFNIMIPYQLKDAILAEVNKKKILIPPYMKTLSDTVDDCLIYLDKIENDEHCNIYKTLMNVLLLLKRDLFYYWHQRCVGDLNLYWDRCVTVIVGEILGKHRVEEERASRKDSESECGDPPLPTLRPEPEKEVALNVKVVEVVPVVEEEVVVLPVVEEEEEVVVVPVEEEEVVVLPVVEEEEEEIVVVPVEEEEVVVPPDEVALPVEEEKVVVPPVEEEIVVPPVVEEVYLPVEEVAPPVEVVAEVPTTIILVPVQVLSRNNRRRTSKTQQVKTKELKTSQKEVPVLKSSPQQVPKAQGRRNRKSVVPEVEEPIRVIHTCSFLNPVVEVGNFNAEEVRAALKATWGRLIIDPNTIFV